MDVIKDGGLLFLGSRLKRIGERMQGDVARIIADAGLPIQPTHYPVLAIEHCEPVTVGDIATAIGASQPAVTRSLGQLASLGWIAIGTSATDRRQKAVVLSDAGRTAMAASRVFVWPHVEAAVADVCADLPRGLLPALASIEAGLAASSLDARAARGPMAGLRIRPFDDSLKDAFHDINAAWIAAMFTLEGTDREVLENPRDRIIAPGGDILFVEDDVGIIGTCALQRTGDRRFELTKMGVTEAARGRKAGEFLLRATLRRARDLGADLLYLLTNSACAPAIHLYEKLGFVHDEAIMREFGSRYRRCDVAMRFSDAASEAMCG